MGKSIRSEPRQLTTAADGEHLWQLITDTPVWVHRRVDSLRLSDGGTTRRHVSVDLTIPIDRVVTGSRNQMLVPMGVLEKGSKQRLDASYDGKSIPILGRLDSSPLSVAMLRAATPDSFDVPPSARGEQAALYAQIAGCSTSQCTEVLAAYAHWRERHLKLFACSTKRQSEVRSFDGLVRLMVRNYVLLGEVPSDLAGRRLVLKYAMDQEEEFGSRAVSRTVSLLQVIPDLGFAASQHFELEVPIGLNVSRLTLVDVGEDPDGANDVVETAYSIGRVCHVNLNPRSAGATGVLRADVAVATQGIFRFTVGTVIALALLVSAAWVIRWFDGHILLDGPTIPSPAASIVLIGPALLISWMSRQPEHPVVARAVQPLRNILFLVAICLVIMAGLAAVAVQHLIWVGAWVLVTGLALWVIIRLIRFAPTGHFFSRRKSNFGIDYGNDQED